ncbi:MAG TPA: hypothetical protein VIC62_14220, partial [Nakamurella sp.]
MVDAVTGQDVAPLDERGRLLAGSEPRADRPLDLLDRPTHVGAVRGEHLDLVPDRSPPVGNVEEVAGIGIFGDQPQRPPLPGAPDQDRRVWLGERQRAADRSIEAV